MYERHKLNVYDQWAGLFLGLLNWRGIDTILGGDNIREVLQFYFKLLKNRTNSLNREGVVSQLDGGDLTKVDKNIPVYMGLPLSPYTFCFDVHTHFMYERMTN